MQQKISTVHVIRPHQLASILRTLKYMGATLVRKPNRLIGIKTSISQFPSGYGETLGLLDPNTPISRFTFSHFDAAL